jgi:hypothetical protein
MEQPFLIFLAMIALVIVVRVIAGSADRERIENELRERGAEPRSVTWTPFGKGWFGDKSDRIYEVKYVDANGDTRVGTFKTSMLSGVYSTDDRVVASAPPDPSEVADTDATVRDLAAENARLRAELERLRGSQSS